jgi:hypothetical protein
MSGGKYRNAPGSCQLLLQQKVDGLLDGLFPLRCALCGARAAGFCRCPGGNNIVNQYYLTAIHLITGSE